MGKIVNQGKSSPEEMDWLNARQATLKVTKTTVTPSGQTLDWIPIESQGTEKIATPPPGEAFNNQRDEKGPLNDLHFEIGEQGPEGHVPVLRPDLSKLPATISIKDLFIKRGGLQVNSHRRNKKPSDPNPFGYFHASSSETTNVFGCEAWLNVWDPQINIPSSPGDDHSISQTWLQNYQAAQTHSIEAGWTVDLGLNGDLQPHLFTYYTTNGYGPGGDNLGGYNRLQAGWKQYHASIYPGILLSPTSVINGAQVELGIKFQLWQGNWWFGIRYVSTGGWIWLGYYPGTLFAGGLVNHAEWVAFGGEVYSVLPNPCTTTDQMGSGDQAVGGYRLSAYQRNIYNQSNAGGSLVNFNGTAEVDAAANNCAQNNYTIQAFMNSNTNWGSYQYFGGPTLRRFFKIPTEGIWHWVDYGTMVDDGVHPWNPDFRYLLTGIVMADLAKYSSPSVTKEMLGLAAKQISEASKGIVNEIKNLSENLEE
jgi:hypothetical protein